MLIFSNGGWQDDAGGDAIARCSDCTNFPAEPECCTNKYIKIILFSIVNYVSVTCCNEVIVSTSNTNVATSYLGTYTYNSADALVGDRKIYKNGDKCLYYYTGNQRWLMVSCTDVGSGSR